MEDNLLIYSYYISFCIDVWKYISLHTLPLLFNELLKKIDDCIECFRNCYVLEVGRIINNNYPETIFKVCRTDVKKFSSYDRTTNKFSSHINNSLVDARNSSNHEQYEVNFLYLK